MGPLFWGLLAGLGIGLLVASPLILKYLFQVSSERISDDRFSSNGVSVDFAAKTIAIKNRTYPVNDVTGLSWSEGVTTITVNDLRKPVHKIKFVTRGQAEKFGEKLILAIGKADGPSFTFN
ncbi:MAG: hypothetical protein WC807_19550 [Hyphomicrobium sp.]|jgi:hypothetical protein